ncbi:hypothetical protein TrLO_g8341 [Triparma laevis f. longispina]|uniref:Uncharacterized protein n=1 Tax=Triparma laevis f. longispina TaxID=1714387 RepID=A0A9W7KT21_9STRA|nr:hypothetical protein TrLO_g8341 [Triparma laevis f. longispina]
MALRLASKSRKRMADAFIDKGVKSGAMIVHGGKDTSNGDAGAQARQERLQLVTRVIFLLNITKMGANTCVFAVNLVVVDIPEGVERISTGVFYGCLSLTTVSFPTTLTSIGVSEFERCPLSLSENFDLSHTNLQEIGNRAFRKLHELNLHHASDDVNINWSRGLRRLHRTSFA